MLWKTCSPVQGMCRDRQKNHISLEVSLIFPKNISALVWMLYTMVKKRIIVVMYLRARSSISVVLSANVNCHTIGTKDNATVNKGKIGEYDGSVTQNDLLVEGPQLLGLSMRCCVIFNTPTPWAPFQYNYSVFWYMITITKIRRSWYRLIFIMGIPIFWYDDVYILRRPPECHWSTTTGQQAWRSKTIWHYKAKLMITWEIYLWWTTNI